MNPLALALCGEVSVAFERTGNHSERGQFSVLNLLEGIASTRNRTCANSSRFAKAYKARKKQNSEAMMRRRGFASANHV